MATRKKKASTTKTDSGSEDEALSYEDAMGELQTIVERMEDGGQSLEESVRDFERGMTLKKICEARLRHAEARIDKLVKKAGDYVAEDFEPDA